MPYVKMGRVRHAESVNLFWALRGLSLPPIAVSGNWGGLCVGDRGALKAACALIGAGAVGALLVLRYSPNSFLSSKFSSTSRASPAVSSEEDIAIQGDEELTVPGLQNAGNNCFLNVILQALASSKAFVTFMASCAEVTSKSKMKCPVTCSKVTVSMPLAVSVSSLMTELSQLGEAHRTSSPRRVMLALKSYVKHFDLASQQDAAEALVHLASAIQEECDNYIQWLKPTFQTFATASLILNQGSSDAGEEAFKHRGGDQLLESWRQHLHWPLEGTLASSLTCQRCAYQYTTQIQFFNDISLSPLQDKEGNIMQGCTLENCLEQFTGPEWIDDVKCINCSHEAAVFSIYTIFRDSRSRTSKGSQSEEYAKVLQSKLKIIEECSCDEYCGCENLTRQQGGIWSDVYASASKRLKIGRSPEVLCLQLQRVVMSEDGALKKLTGHVAFPKVLDLFPFTIAAESSTLKRENTVIERDKDFFPAKSLQKGTRSSNEEETHFAGQISMPENEAVSNGGAELGDKGRGDTAEILCLPQGEPSDICLADSVESAKSWNLLSTDADNTATVDEPLKQYGVPAEHLASEQTSKREEVPFEEYNSTLPLLSTSSGSILTYSPMTLSIYSPYIPRVFPRQLQPWSLVTPQDGQQFSVSNSSILGNVSDMNSAPNNTNSSITRGSKYSRRLLYELVSVVVHQGGPQSGHYIVYRKMIQQNGNENLVFKEIPLLHQPADQQTPEQKDEKCASSVCSDDQVVAMQPGTDANKHQPPACHPVESNLLSGQTCDGGTTLPVAQFSDSDSEELLGSRSQAEDTTLAPECLEQENVGDKCREAKPGQDRSGTTDKLIVSWFRVSDTHVQRVPEQEVFSARASLLFYEQL